MKTISNIFELYHVIVTKSTFLLKILNKYNDHEFKSINQSALDDLTTEEEKEKLEEQQKDHQDLLIDLNS